MSHFFPYPLSLSKGCEEIQKKSRQNKVNKRSSTLTCHKDSGKITGQAATPAEAKHSVNDTFSRCASLNMKQGRCEPETEDQVIVKENEPNPGVVSLQNHFLFSW